MATFRHKTVRRFMIPKSRRVPREFKFLNHLLHIDNERDAEIFRGIVERLPRSQSVNIVEINEAAVAALEKPVRKSIRGVQQSTQVADAGLAAKQAKAQEEAARVEADAKIIEDEKVRLSNEAKAKAEAEAKTKAAESEPQAGNDAGEAGEGSDAKQAPTLNIKGQASSTSAKK